MNQHYIVIEGAIGVGKTTLARMLKDRFNTEILLEVFEENPFLAKFYESRVRYAFQTQMFFLLSRYRQQHEQVTQCLTKGGLVSDYMFAKDWLFAQLNLYGDEWDVYQQIHAALALQIPDPDLIVYLQASTDVLMGRIAQRDRPYERDMERSYIDTLQQTYDHYFAQQQDIPVLIINTDELNIVTNPADFQRICEEITETLSKGQHQDQSPKEPDVQSTDLLSHGRPLGDFQKFHVGLDRSKGFNANVYFNFLRLSEEIGELGSELAKLWSIENTLIAQGYSEQRARQEAIRERNQIIEAELADCMAYLLKLANYTGVEMETAYLKKMRENVGRDWD